MKDKDIYPVPSSTPVDGEPTDSWELINKYGTYEVQDTADTDNTFPTIAQGLSDNVEDYLPEHVELPKEKRHDV